jgi:hypothetical protein
VNSTFGTALCGAETRALRKADHKYLVRFKMWCRRRMDRIRWTDRVRNVEVLHRVKEERNIIHTVKLRKVNWIGDMLRRNCLLSRIIERKQREG